MGFFVLMFLVMVGATIALMIVSGLLGSLIPEDLWYLNSSISLVPADLIVSISFLRTSCNCVRSTWYCTKLINIWYFGWNALSFLLEKCAKTKFMKIKKYNRRKQVSEKQDGVPNTPLLKAFKIVPRKLRDLEKQFRKLTVVDEVG